MFKKADRVLGYWNGQYIRGVVDHVIDVPHKDGAVVSVFAAHLPVRQQNVSVSQFIYAVLNDGTCSKDIHPAGTFLIAEPDLYYVDFGDADPDLEHFPLTAFTDEAALREFYAGTPFGSELCTYIQGYRVQGIVKRVPPDARVWVADLKFPTLRVVQEVSSTLLAAHLFPLA